MHYDSLIQIRDRLVAGEVTSVQVTSALLQRIAALEGDLKAFALILKERALAQAEALDQKLAAGGKPGPLHGVPIAVKDLIYLQGYPNASGTRVMADFVPTFDATVLERLEQAGAVVVGKTQLTEGAFGSHHPDIDPPRNPWGAQWWTGVSSSGSGVAAAAGLAYATLGSDTGGSIRFPSAACGLVGVKPTYGRVSRHGVFPLAESLDHIGPMTRTVADAALMLGVMAGYDDADSTSLSEPVPDYVSSCLSENSLDGVKIGIDWEYCTAGVDDEVVEELRRVADQFVALGAQLVEVTLPASYRDLVSGWGITCGVECARAHAAYYPARAYEYGPVLSQLIELGRAVPPDRYALLEHVREVFRSGFDALLEQVDVFLSPCMTCLPLPVEVMENTAAAEDSRADFITFTAPFDYSGHPTLTLPAGVRGGKPVSFQLVGPWLGEAQLFSIGTAYENLQGVQPHPPL